MSKFASALLLEEWYFHRLPRLEVFCNRLLQTSHFWNHWYHFSGSVMLFNKRFPEGLVCLVNHHIDTLEMIRRFHNIAHIHWFDWSYGIRFINVAGLVVGQGASLDMVGIIAQFNLNLVVNASCGFTRLFFKTIPSVNLREPWSYFWTTLTFVPGSILVLIVPSIPIPSRFISCYVWLLTRLFTSSITSSTE